MNMGWRYYNHALLPTSAPHEKVNVSLLADKEIWKNQQGMVFFARWTSDFDCKSEEKWWYVIKDSEFDISALKAKRRYEINKGKKNFNIEVIQPQNYISEIIEIHKKAYEEYPEKYRPEVDEQKLTKQIENWTGNTLIYGAFSVEDNRLVGFAMLIKEKDHANFAMLKTIPLYERFGINAAIVAGILEDFADELKAGYYICDGERSLFHETNFQEYLEKYFGFRKAYCKLHIKFRPIVSFVLTILAPFKELLSDTNALTTKIKVLLKYRSVSEEFGGKE